MNKIDSETTKKFDLLKEDLKNMESVAVAFSGGVDSTFLLKVSHDVLGDRAVAVTARSCTFPERELNEAKEFCRREGIRQYIVEHDELEVEGFKENPKNRCYLCKTTLFRNIIALTEAHGIAYVAEGSNLDDNGDYRPGLEAVRELHVASPLRKAGLTKQEIRTLSKELGLPTWDKPSFACLSSRFVYGETITREKLHMVDQAEQLLMDMGFRQFRVRIHGEMARIEVLPEDFPRLLEENSRRRVVDTLQKLGFTYISLDLKGYRTGSMNETLEL